MRTLRYLLEKEFKQILRDRFLPKILFIVPMMQLIILPFAANFEMRNINLSIVDNDRTASSVRLTNKILSSGYFRLTDLAGTYDKALESIESDKADIILEIPAKFEHDMDKDGAEVLIAANAVNGTKGGLGSSYLTSIIQDFSQGENATPEPVSRNIRTTYLFNPHLGYKNYMVPGIMVFLLTLVGGAFSALNVVSEKEKGTIEQINVSPIPKALFILSKLIPFWLIGLALLTIAMAIALGIYGLIPAGKIGLIYLFGIVYMIAFTGFGLTISAVSSTQQQAMFTAFFFLIIFALMSGLFTPINSMPEWAQTVTRFNPVRYMVEVMRMIYLKGSSFTDLQGHFIIISLYGLFFNLLAIICYRKNDN